ncbi:MAG: Verru_Chthon cassette protein A [Terrimicrobiaceae bacterium]|nr:Verru_Chthon cassette protein A [Terrimicrobiaceae bacterium]
MIQNPAPIFARRSERGVALVIVLGCLVLLSVLILAFLNNVRTDLQASKSYSDSSAVRILADTAVNVVEAQIRQATTETGHAWASQPGMLRTYDNGGALVHAYKLYSADNMIANAVSPTAEAASLNGWNAKPALFTDLNEPALDAFGNNVYPILTPPPAVPVLDGYSVSTPPNPTATQPVPMPASWLYVLQDGTLVAPTGSGTTAAVGGAAKANPIIGRIAFWADDETCKVNINTAGGDGVAASATDSTNVAKADFWSPPFFCAPDDANLARFQPAAGEIQRYPGHPATVALRNLLNGLGWNTLSAQQFYNQVGGTGAITTPGITPRYAFGGSKGATVVVDSATSIPIVSRPLYATVDEMLFQPSLARTPSLLNSQNALAQQRIETSKFFLTAHSRAPELNLFGQPRVSVWPVWDPTTGRNLTAIDKLLAFCATVGTGGTAHPYYFTRKDCKDSTADIGILRNQTLLRYLDFFTSTGSPIPGFGGSFQSSVKYGTTGVRQILTEIFDYIRTVNMADSTQAVPGATVTSANQYIRPWVAGDNTWGLYQVAPSLNNNTWSDGTTYQGFGSFPRLTEVAIQFAALGRNLGAANNIRLSSNYRNPTDVVAALGLAGTGDSGTITQDNTVSPTAYQTPGNTTAVQAFILLQFVNPSQMLIGSSTGTSGVTNQTAGQVFPCCWVEINGLDNLQLNSHPLSFPAHEAMIIGSNTSGDRWGTGQWGNISFITQTGAGGRDKLIGRSLLGGDMRGKNPFYSVILPITVNSSGSGTMNFTGGTITVSLYDGTGSQSALSGHRIQTYTIQIPNGTFPVPTPRPLLGNSGFSPPVIDIPVASIGIFTALPANPTPSARNTDRWTREHDGTQTIDSVLNSGDVIESMVLNTQWSDARMLAISNVPSSAFTTHPLWGGQFAHKLTYGNGTPFYYYMTTGSPLGVLVNSIPQTSFIPTGTFPPPKNVVSLSYPVVSPRLTIGSVNLPNNGAGDWDNGLGSAMDGPWINKADEGNIYPPQSGGGFAYFTAGHSLNAPGSNFFSPNRQVPSPGMFGSLPTGVDPSGSAPKPYQTLLFRPGPTLHKGMTSPRDHLLLDLFWMPVAEPYAISEPFSTAGKINLNYQIMPYTYITRSTALRAVLATEKIAQVNGGQGVAYKVNYDLQAGQGGPSANGGQSAMSVNARFPINLNATLAQFDDKFNGTNNSGVNSSTTPDLFRSASQICETYLVPRGTYTSASQFANDWYITGTGGRFALVGDNVRERPYTDIYGRVTTKSNTFQVHYRVQSLQKRTNSTQGTWDETKDIVTGEKRGAVIIERYLDPNATITTDPAATPALTNSLEGNYKFRIVNSTNFHP